MFIQLVIATLMVLVTVIIHLVGLAVLVRILRSHSRLFQSPRILPISLLIGAAMGIVAIHTVEIWVYALLYDGIGAFRTFEEALYFSTVTYSTIGYGDVVMRREWRILGSIEGANGILMLGWSTAFLVSLLSQLRLLGHDWLSRGKD
ncbi:potassium channel family protein [Sphingomonas limnosediminicola]|uniref:Potassium channel family protein n=1 Tax=Sphingomonas limnosediminicola TaxID=940133 RepID=A0ABP7L0Z7_9SPHN